MVGCLWPSSDRECVKVVKLFYSSVFEDGAVRCDDKAVAVALHKAAVEVRDSDEYRKRPCSGHNMSILAHEL